MKARINFTLTHKDAVVLYVYIEDIIDWYCSNPNLNPVYVADMDCLTKLQTRLGNLLRLTHKEKIYV